MRAETKYLLKPSNQNVVVAELSAVKNPEMEIREKCSVVTQNIICEAMQIYSDYNFSEGKSFKGIAVCQPEDEFDELIGKQIASIKADQKYHNAMIRKYNMMIDQFMLTISELADLASKHNDAISSLDKRYKDVIEKIQSTEDVKLEVNSEAVDTEEM